MYFLFLDNAPAVEAYHGWAHAVGADRSALAIYSGSVVSDSLVLLGLNILDDAGALVSTPQASVWYYVDVGWALQSGFSARSVTTSLDAAGVEFDRAFDCVTRDCIVPPHTILLGGRHAIDMGLSPDNDAVYLTPLDAALGFWRVRFPASGIYTFVLDDIGQQSVTVAAAPVTISPTITVLKMNPLNRESSILVRFDYTGEYPEGGLYIPDGSLGRPSYFFGDINAQPPYQFSYIPGDPTHIHVYTVSGEINAGDMISFSTTALFIGP